jgi:hypothetical protein
LAVHGDEQQIFRHRDDYDKHVALLPISLLVSDFHHILE